MRMYIHIHIETRPPLRFTSRGLPCFLRSARSLGCGRFHPAPAADASRAAARVTAEGPFILLIIYAIEFRGLGVRV